MRILLIALVVLGLLVVAAPASLVDRAVSEIGRGGVHVGSTSGTIWSGRGVVSVVDVATQTWRPWHRVEWSFDPIGLFRGRLEWLIIINNTRPSVLSIGVSGWRISDLRIAGPARNFLQRIPGAMSGFGWEGDISLEAARFECSWRDLCTGRIGANWVAAGSDFLPGQVFGDYRVDVDAAAGRYAVAWSSSETSFVRTWGKGEISEAGGLRLEGSVKSDPALMSRLPAIAGPWVRPTQAPDTWKIVYP